MLSGTACGDISGTDNIEEMANVERKRLMTLFQELTSDSVSMIPAKGVDLGAIPSNDDKKPMRFLITRAPVRHRHG